jgi:cytoskeletal protein RodZ
MNDGFGSYLKKERELRSIPLDELAEQTHIKMDYLEAMESDHFEKLPGMTFVRGYLKAYAGYVGLLPEEVLLRFEDYLNKLSGKHRPPREKSNPRLFWLMTFMVLVVVATVLLTWFRK